MSKNIQLIADLSYSDIVIYIRPAEKANGATGAVDTAGPKSPGPAPSADSSNTVVAVAAARPNTSVSVHPENIVGQELRNPPQAILKAFAEGKPIEDRNGELDAAPIRIFAIPIKESGKVIAVMTSERRAPGDMRPSEMEQMYMGAADDLIDMIKEGVDVGIDFSSAKEAGDGLLRVDRNGVITYASPNAVTIYRRLGVESLVGKSISRIGLDETPVLSALEDRKAAREEINEKDMTVVKKAIPVIEKDRVKGVIAIVRDITDVRAREQQLKIKETTIREIHHRVKNNLQTIASLLRLQSRRMTTPEARLALLESVGRISSIAVVHEILSQSGSGSLDFKEIAQNINSMIQNGLVRPDKKINIITRGVGGQIPSPMATSLALILTELVQNAVEHGFSGRKTGKITISLERRGKMLTMTVQDNGVGLPPDFSIAQSSNLGLQIVHTLVTDELGGSWEMQNEPDGGTRVMVRVPVDSQG